MAKINPSFELYSYHMQTNFSSIGILSKKKDNSCEMVNALISFKAFRI